MTERLELHELCSFFPPMEGVEFEEFKKDLQAYGLREPIVLFEGKILDGQNRYRGCTEAGVQLRIREYKGKDPAAYVISANHHRRHSLTAGQRAAIVALASDWSRARQQGGDGSNQFRQVPENKEDQQTCNVAPLLNQTVADRAAQSGASKRTQIDADAVAKADPALAKQVAAGKVSLGKAKRKVSPPKEKKEKTAAQVKREAKAAAKAEKEEEERQLAKDAGFLDPVSADELAKLTQENEALQKQLAVLTATDQGKELRRQMDLREHAVRERDVEMDKAARMKPELDRLRRYQGEVVKATGADTPQNALAWIKAQRAKST